METHAFTQAEITQLARKAGFTTGTIDHPGCDRPFARPLVGDNCFFELAQLVQLTAASLAEIEQKEGKALTEIARLRAENEALRAENEALRAEAERLDWMIEHPNADICLDPENSTWFVWICHSNLGNIGEGSKTAREAIDAARSATAEKGGAA